MFSQDFVRRIFISGIFLAILAVPICAQFIPGEATDAGLGGNNNIVGTVYTSGGRLNRRVTIRLTTMTRGDRVASTDDNGSFAFRGLTSGTYTIIIEKEKEFEPYQQAVDIIQLRGSPPATMTLSIRLELKSSTIPKPGVLDAAIASLTERGKTIFAKAQELAKANDHAGAVEQLILLTAEFPKFVDGFNELGLQYMQLGNLERADAAFQAAIKLDSAAFQPKFNYGMMLVMMKRYSDAEPVLRSAEALNDQSGPVKYFLGTALANLGKFDEAEKELSAAVAAGGNEMVEAHRILAIIYNVKGDKKRAAAEIEVYLKINPTAPDAEQLKKVREQLLMK
jgi:Flp pilus assembly protein TadD, contains TPR repeats